MVLHVFVFLFVVYLLLSLALLWRLDWFPRRPSSSRRGGQAHQGTTSAASPHCPDDCPACRLGSTPASAGGSATVPVRPWSEVKSRRGAPKRVNTEGYACPNQQCPYFGITDAHIHALVGDGNHGQTERIQTFRCQACRITFTSRRNTPLYRLKTPSQQVTVVLSALAKGLDPSAAERVFGFRQATITSLSVPRLSNTLSPCTNASSVICSSHTSNWMNCEPGCAAPLRCVFLWLAIDPCTKILPVLHLGPRTQNAAHPVIHSLRRLLAHECLPLFTSDGLHMYFYGLTAHFGQWLQVGQRGRNVRRWQVAAGLIYAQVKKSYRRRKLVRVSHVMRLGTEDALTITLQGLGFSGRLNTAFIERVKLTPVSEPKSACCNSCRW